jgi:hypothetical protein
MAMRTIYSIDKDSIFSGGIFDIGPNDGRPKGWVTSETPPPDGLAQWNGNGWTLLNERPPLAPPTSQDVNAERDRRMYSTFTFEGVVYACDNLSMGRITGAAALGGFAARAGSPVGNLAWGFS